MYALGLYTVADKPTNTSIGTPDTLEIAPGRNMPIGPSNAGRPVYRPWRWLPNAPTAQLISRSFSPEGLLHVMDRKIAWVTLLRVLAKCNQKADLVETDPETSQTFATDGICMASEGHFGERRFPVMSWAVARA